MINICICRRAVLIKQLCGETYLQAERGRQTTWVKTNERNLRANLGWKIKRNGIVFQHVLSLKNVTIRLKIFAFPPDLPIKISFLRLDHLLFHLLSSAELNRSRKKNLPWKNNLIYFQVRNSKYFSGLSQTYWTYISAPHSCVLYESQLLMVISPRSRFPAA